ncbi:hypothetical protein GF339_19965 [candidate division KSB3 bacterium]|uniref:Uncharacterized protein n=1 Tax=candidate division KSB3 bacterium TaxID=2044937 RepID=A0A9D5JZK0_9BACT|nr:hypothetical protein [candidate division KSB3 bacterium]MBD3326871.1 hypothetical protein [candidate division KSB3 bacterium]
MRKYLSTMATLVLLLGLCSGIIVGCDDDDDDSRSTIMDTIANDDPSYGFLVNSTTYRMVLDLGEAERFNLTLEPGAIISLNLQTQKTHLIHVVVLNQANRAIADYVNGFYIDEIPLDNRLKDFICSWYVEFISDESGFGNNFGT